MKIKQTQHTMLCASMAQESSAFGETNDCAVRAVAILCEIPYKAAHAALAAQGRKPGQGTFNSEINTAIRKLGFNMEFVANSEFISRYPGSHKTLRSVTTHHPARFNKVWKDGARYLAYVHGHCLAIVDGETHDWSTNRSLQVYSLYKITKKETV